MNSLAKHVLCVTTLAVGVYEFPIAYGQGQSPASSAQATSQAAEERFMSDEEFIKIGEDFDFDAYITSLTPPSVAEIIKSRRPIPTVEKIRDDLKQPERRPKPPTLPDSVAGEVKELESRIARLEANSVLFDSAAEQRRAIDEAIDLSDRVLQLRTESGAPATWYPVIVARLRVDTLTRLRDNTSTERRRWLAAKRRDTNHEATPNNDRELATVRSQLAIRRGLFPFDHAEIVTTLNEAAYLFQCRGMLDKAEPLYCGALAMCSRLFPVDSDSEAQLLNNLAVLLQARGALADAEELYREALSMRLRISPSDHPGLAEALSNLASILQARGALSEAEVLSRDALSMRQRIYPGDHPDVALNLNSLAFILLDCRKPTEAEPLCRNALAMSKRLFSGDHSSVAVSLNNLASALAARGDFVESEGLYRDALEMYRRLYSRDHPDIGLGLNNLAFVLQSRGALVQAETLYREALVVYQRLFPGDHPAVARALNNLANVLLSRGALRDAEPYCRNALAMYHRMFPGDHPEVARSLHSIAVVLRTRGAISEAESSCVHALAMYQRLFPGDYPDKAQCVNNLAVILQTRGNFSEAERLYRDALAMYRRLFQGDHQAIARGVSNLADDLRDLGRFVEAEALYSDALGMYNRLFQGDHPDKARTLNNLGFVQQARDALAVAERSYVDAIAMYGRLFPGDHAATATCKYNLARVLAIQGRYPDAEPLAREAMDVTERLRTQIVGEGLQRAEYASELRLFGRAHAYAIVLAKLQRTGEVLATLERGRSRAALDLLMRSQTNLIVEPGVSQQSDREQRLERATRAEQSARIALSDAESALAERYNERAASKMLTDKPEEERAERLAEFDHEIASLLEDVEQNRQAWTRAGGDVMAETRGLFPIAQPRSTDEILKTLAFGEAVVSFSWGKDSVLVAVAGGGKTTAAIVAENNERTAELTQAAVDLRTALCTLRPFGPLNASAARELATILLPEPVHGYLSAAKRLLIVADGPLSGIPFEAFAAIDPESPLAGKAIVYAPSVTMYLDREELGARDQTDKLASTTTGVVLGSPVFDRNRKEPEYPAQGVLLVKVVDGGNAAEAGLKRGDVLLRYGDQQLDESTPLQKAIAAATDSAQKGERPADAPVKIAYWRDGREFRTEVPLGKIGVLFHPSNPADGLRSMTLIDAVTRGGGEFEAGVSATDQVRLYGGVLPPLPGTQREAKSIAALVGADGGKSTLLIGGDASIPKLWEAVTSNPPRYLHLATHGLMGSADRPMDASLALTQPEKPTPDDVGFLRLDDLIGRWGGKLRGCELVVLSACDTQRGIQKGDSSFSLPLGFFFAGAKTVVASLWKVDDTATQLLMTRFYENLLGKFDAPRSVDGETYAAGKCLPKLAALREAQAWLRSLSWEEARKCTEMTEAQFHSYAASRGIGQPTTAPRGELKQDAPFAHPYYWAAFIMIGDPG